jgi:hypothetical protein
MDHDLTVDRLVDRRRVGGGPGVQAVVSALLADLDAIGPAGAWLQGVPAGKPLGCAVACWSRGSPASRVGGQLLR